MATQEELLQKNYDINVGKIRAKYERARRELADRYDLAEQQQEANLESRGILRSGEAQTGRARLSGQRTTGESDLAAGETADLASEEIDYLTKLAQLQAGGAGGGGAGGGGTGGGGTTAPSAPSAPTAGTTPSLPSGSWFGGTPTTPSLPSGSLFGGMTPAPSAPTGTVSVRPPGLTGSADTMERRLTTPAQPSQAPSTVYIPGIGTFGATPTTTTTPRPTTTTTTTPRPTTTTSNVTKPGTTFNYTPAPSNKPTVPASIAKPTNKTKPTTGKPMNVGRL